MPETENRLGNIYYTLLHKCYMHTSLYCISYWCPQLLGAMAKQLAMAYHTVFSLWPIVNTMVTKLCRMDSSVVTVKIDMIPNVPV